jgi:hypothetical protein
MRRSNLVNRTWLSVVGVATAVTTTAATWAPVTAAAPTLDTTDNAQSQRADDAVDGTYESCAAYFGLGKYDGGLDIVEFDVADTNGADGAAHAVPNDTQVVLVLGNAAGDELKCAPVEVTEAMWNDAMDDLDLNYLGFSPEHPLPSWPGPGHYIYPTVNFEPYITGAGAQPGTDFGTVTSVGFEVTSIPDGHSLVSPTGLRPLAEHYPGRGESSSDVDDPLVSAYLTSTVDADAAAAFSAALMSCGPDGEDLADLDDDLLAAIHALEAYRGYEPSDAEWLDCYAVRGLNGEASFQLDLSDTVNYVEPIRLSLPTTPPTTTPPTTTPPTTTPPTTTAPATTSTTAPPAAPPAVAAEPVSATPAYTG